MNFEELTVREMRDTARQLFPEVRGVGGLAHTGSKEQLIELLRSRGVTPGEVKEAAAGNKTVEAPKDSGDIPVGGGEDAGDDLPGITGEEGSGEPEKSKSEQPKESKTPCDDELELIRRIITKNVKPEGVDEEAVSKIVEKKLSTFRKSMVKVIEVKQPAGIPNKVIGMAHRLTEQIAKVCNIGIHQMLVGPAGGGKTTCCEKVAEILDLKFYPMSVGPQTTKSDLLGFIDAAGNYHTTPLREAFEKGGLLLLDEVDAANAGVLTIINALLGFYFVSSRSSEFKERNYSSLENAKNHIIGMVNEFKTSSKQVILG